MKKGASTIFKEIGAMKGKPQVAALSEAIQSNQTIHDLCILAYHPAVRFGLPEGVPPFEPCKEEHLEMVLNTQMRRLMTIIEGAVDNMTQYKRESIFIDILKTIKPADAGLLITVKDKYIPWGITEELVRKAAPNLLPSKE